MSSLSFENIDRWLFEYTEGNLSPEQVDQLEHFLSMHPELQLELDAWKSSKVAPELETSFNEAAFQKSYNVWPLLTSLFLAFLGVGSLFYFYDFKANIKYAQKSIDLELIGDEDNFIFMGTSKTSISAQTSIHNTSIEPLISSVNTTIGTVANGVRNGAFYPSVTSKSDSPQNGLSSSTFNMISTFNPIATELHEDEARSEIELTDRIIEAPSLESVKKSLIHKDAVVTVFANRDNTKSSSAKSNSSLSNKAKTVFRKVQRMMDQPIALRNFKDPHYAIPNISSYQANFGMAGTMFQHRFQATSRNQWVGRENQQLMSRVAWDGYIRPLRGGVGIDLNYNDYQNGSVRDMLFGLTYSPKFSVSKNVSFEPAVRFKMGMTDVNLSSGIIGSTIEMNRRNSIAMFENGESPLGSQLWYRDLGVGALVNTKWFYAGLNLDNVGRHYNNFYSSDLTLNHTADLDFSAVFGTEYKSLNKDITLSTYAYYQNFGEVNEVWGGANVRWRNVQFGGAASNNLDLGATAGVVFDRFTVHYNLDYLTSVVLDQRMLSHQVTMRMLLKPNRLTMKFLNM